MFVCVREREREKWKKHANRLRGRSQMLGNGERVRLFGRRHVNTILLHRHTKTQCGAETVSSLT